jgi:hypothetical protein
VTPDLTCILDTIPGHPNIAFGCGFSGDHQKFKIKTIFNFTNKLQGLVSRKLLQLGL